MSAITAKWRRYREYRLSGVEWLGEIPHHWEVLRLKYSADLVNQKVNGSESDLPYTGLEHVESWTGKRITTNGEASSDGQASAYRSGDVLFGKLRPYLAKVYAAETDGICTGELLVLRPRIVLQKYLRDYLLSPDFISVVDSSTYGAKMPRASWDFIGNLPSLVPPVDEQRAIASFLDRETSRIDTLISKKEQQIALLQEKRIATISNAVTKGLDPNAKMKDSGIEWLGKIPEHWEVKRAKTVLARNDGGVWGEDFDDGGTIVLRSTEQTVDGNWHIVEPAKRRLSAHEHASTVLLEGDLVVTKSSGSSLHIGKTSIVTKEIAALNCCYSNFMQRLRAQRVMVPRFLWYVLNGEIGRKQFDYLSSTTTGLANLNGEIIGNVKAAFPPRDEQRVIATFLDRETVRIDVLLKKVEESIDILHEYRKALISAAVTGKIDVRDAV